MADFLSSSSRKDNQADILETVKCFLSVMPPGSEINLTVTFNPSNRLPTSTNKSNKFIVQEEMLKLKKSDDDKSSVGPSFTSSRKRRNKREKKEKRLRRERRMLQRQDSESSMMHRINGTEPDEHSDLAITEQLFPPATWIQKKQSDKNSVRKEDYPAKSKTDEVPLATLRNPQESMMPRKNGKSDNQSNYEQIN